MGKVKEKKEVQVSKVAAPPSVKKVISMLEESGVSREKVCRVLAEGLEAMKPVVCDGEIFSEVDYAVRHKYVETVLEVMGEKKFEIPKGELHYHFTNVLQLVEAYERGDKRAIDDARRIFEGGSIEAGGVEEGSGEVL